MILKNCSVILTQDPKRNVLRDADILIEGGIISRIGQIKETEGHEKIDCRGKIALPSFINMHTHLPMTLLRGYKDDLELSPWLDEIWKVEAKMGKKEYCTGARFSCLEMIKSGTGAFVDGYFGQTAIAKAISESGLRGYLGEALIDRFNIEHTGEALSLAKKSIAFIEELKNPLLKPVIAPHSVYTCSEALLLEAKKLAEEKNLLYTIHLSETRKEIYDCHKRYGKRPVEFLDSLGIIDSRFVGFHSAWLTKGEISVLGRNNASAVYCPISNMKLATGGAFPYREMNSAGVKIGLGTDGASSNNSLNMLLEMKVGCLKQKWTRWNAGELNSGRVLSLATSNGAKILGLNSGSLEEGKNADLIMMDKKHYSMMPGHDFASNIVYSASREAITDMIVNGKFVMREKKTLTLDEEKTKEDFEEVFGGLI